MKHLHTCLLALCLLGVFTLATAQTPQSQDNKKVVIVKKIVDENGQQTVETIMAEGEEADALMLELAQTDGKAEDIVVINKSIDRTNITSINADEGKNISVDVEENDGNKEIVIDVDGSVEVITLGPGEELTDETRARLAEKGVFLDRTMAGENETIIWRGEGDEDREVHEFRIGNISKGMVALGKGLAHIGDWSKNVWVTDNAGINCAALGVYVSSNSDGGVFVSSTIGASGAEEAGMQRGDVIKTIDEYPTRNYGELHEALALYEPGDVVAVTFTRDGAEQRMEVQLRAWKDFPSFANRPHAHVTCDQATEEVVTRKIIVIKKDRNEEPDVEPANVTQNPIPVETALYLESFTAFPNPTDGKFSVQFSAEALPTVVSVFNAAGKEVFHENLENFSGTYARDIDLTDQVRGGLVLSIEQDGKIFTEQIILN